LEEDFLNTVSSKTTKDLIPVPDIFGCILVFANLMVTKSSLTFTALREHLDFDPFAGSFHKVVKVVDNTAINFKPSRDPPMQLGNGVG
jgi:hypothetical protein